MMTVSGATSGFPAPCRAIICQIIAVRVRKGLTQSEVAERMRVSPARVSQLESGYRTPNLDDDDQDDLDTRNIGGWYSKRGQHPVLSYGIVNEALRHYNEVSTNFPRRRVMTDQQKHGCDQRFSGTLFVVEAA